MAAHGDGAFGALDWALFAGVALTLGSSFALIAVGVDAFAPAVVALGRLVLGAAALALVPAARAPVPRADLPRVGLLGLVWMGVPLVLFPVAERWVASSVAGMLNAAVPLFAAMVAAAVLRRAPAPVHAAGVGVGLVGVALLAGGASAGGGTSAAGVVLLLCAVACYGVAVNLAIPLQRRHGTLPVLLRAEVAGAAMVAPLGLAGLPSSSFSWASLAAVATLGVLGTGLAFAALGVLIGRVGATRGSAVTYLFPVVALGLGAGLRGEAVTAPALAGIVLVLAGAALVGRPARGPVSRPAAPPPARAATAAPRT